MWNLEQIWKTVDTVMHSTLIEAAKSGDLPAVQDLLEEGVNYDATDENGATALMWAALQGHLLIVERLLANHADVSVRDHHNETVLTWAATNTNEQIVRILEEAGTPVTILAAAMTGNIRAMQQFLAEGTDINLCTAHGTTPLLLAAEYGHLSNRTEQVRSFYEFSVVGISTKELRPLT